MYPPHTHTHTHSPFAARTWRVASRPAIMWETTPAAPFPGKVSGISGCSLQRWPVRHGWLCREVISCSDSQLSQLGLLLSDQGIFCGRCCLLEVGRMHHQFSIPPPVAYIICLWCGGSCPSIGSSSCSAPLLEHPAAICLWRTWEEHLEQLQAQEAILIHQITGIPSSQKKLRAKTKAQNDAGWCAFRAGDF